MDPQQINIAAEERMGDLDKQGVQFRLPRPVSTRVDQLTKRARRARTDRSEVVAALLCSRDWTAEEVEEAVRAYRDLQVRQVVLDVDANAKTVTVERHGAGRRPS